MASGSSRGVVRRWAPFLAGIFVSVALVACGSLSGPGIRIDNPYADANWQAGQPKANLHTHTKVSDGGMYPQEVIDAYRDLGYGVLALTDHNRVTYPWSTLREDRGENFENRDPDEVGMAAVQGNELSSHHHMNSLFTDHAGTKTETDSLDGIARKGGLAFLNHPGRYKKSVSWYTDLYSRYDVLVGLEVFNQGDRYSNDRKKWDEILSVMMPERPVWGLSNDDMHARPHLGRNWNVLLIDETNEPNIRAALTTGCFYFVYAPKGHAGAPPPVLTAIDVDEGRGTIAIRAEHADTIEWISGGQVIGRGGVLKITEAEGVGSYVRAVVHGRDGAVACTQPFGIRF